MRSMVYAKLDKSVQYFKNKIFNFFLLSTYSMCATDVVEMHGVVLSKDSQTRGALKLDTAIGLACG